MINLFTTINPNGNFEAQKEAISSWKIFNVYSVNTKDEINKIKDIYPTVNFIETDQITIEGKKKLVKLNGILSAMKQSDSPFNGIINSDIIISPKLTIKSLMKYLKDGSIIVSRYELNNNKTQIFPHGFDLFIFHNSFNNLLKNDLMTIGMPWWDFWIPTVLLSMRQKIYLITDKICLHRTHDTNYSTDLYFKYGRYFLASVNNKYSSDNYVNVYCTMVKRKIDSECFNIKKI